MTTQRENRVPGKSWWHFSAFTFRAKTLVAASALLLPSLLSLSLMACGSDDDADEPALTPASDGIVELENCGDVQPDPRKACWVTVVADDSEMTCILWDGTESGDGSMDCEWPETTTTTEPFG